MRLLPLHRTDDLQSGMTQEGNGKNRIVDACRKPCQLSNAWKETEQPIENQDIAVHEKAKAEKTVR